MPIFINQLLIIVTVELGGYRQPGSQTTVVEPLWQRPILLKPFGFAEQLLDGTGTDLGAGTYLSK